MVTFLVYLAVSKLIQEKMQSFYLIAGYSGFRKYILNYIELMVYFFQSMQSKIWKYPI